MVLDPYQVGFFIEQVGMAAASFGVAKSDINAVAMALETLFDYRCAPKMTAIKAQGAQYQSICTDEKCPMAMNSTCEAQPVMLQPLVANKTLAAGEGRMSSTATSTSASGSGSGSGSSSPSATGNAAVQYQPGLVSVLSAVLAFFAL